MLEKKSSATAGCQAIPCFWTGPRPTAQAGNANVRLGDINVFQWPGRWGSTERSCLDYRTGKSRWPHSLESRHMFLAVQTAQAQDQKLGMLPTCGVGNRRDQ